VIRVRKAGHRHRNRLRLAALRIAFLWAFDYTVIFNLRWFRRVLGYYGKIPYFHIRSRDLRARPQHRPTLRTIITFGLLVAGGRRSYLAAVGISKRAGSRVYNAPIWVLIAHTRLVQAAAYETDMSDNGSGLSGIQGTLSSWDSCMSRTYW
jgi:hypothetical protein